jgi:hypothetical protein
MIFILLLLLYFYLKINLLAFWDAKLLINFLYSRFYIYIFFQLTIWLIHLISLVTLLILGRILSILILKNFFL